MMFVRIIQFILISVPIIFMGWLLRAWMVPSGVFVVGHEVGTSSSFIDELKPSDRVEQPYKNQNSESVQSIVDEPAFFFVHPHRDFFDELVIELWFQNSELPIVELGGLSRINPDIYSLYPVHNKLIDESDWDRLDQDGYVLLQKDKRYTSINEFLQNPPERELLATYRADVSIPFRLDNYQPVSDRQSIDVSLRGHHEFKTYIKDEVLDFAFFYMDMNRDDGEDTIRITLFNEENQPVSEVRATDDGNTIGNGFVDDGLKQIRLVREGLPEGVYKVVIDAPRDIFFRKIETSQQKMVFLRSLFIGDEVGYRDPGRGATFYTASARVLFQTRHAGGVQTVSANQQTLDIDQPYEWYTLIREGVDVGKIELSKPDVEVIGDGVFAFSPDQYFNPDPITLDAYITLEQLDVEYVYAQYTSPEIVGDWLVAKIPFNTDTLYQEEGKELSWKFSFSTPRIKEKSTSFTVHKINLEFIRHDE